MAVVSDLRKRYRPDSPEAVAGISFDIERGEVFGLLGPNGAGKTTTIGVMTTRVRPTGGSVLIDGIDVAKNPVAVKQRIAVVPQRPNLDRAISALENLTFHGAYFGWSRRARRARALELLEQFQLTDRADSMAAELSGGMAQRLMIARAMAHRPSVLFLDEPTSGIDPQNRINLWQILRDLHAQGQTILLTTHYMEEADALCERVAVMDHGRVLADGSPDELKRSIGADTVVTVTFDGPAADLIDSLEQIEGVKKAESPPDTDAHTLRIHATDAEGLIRQIVEVSDKHERQMRDATTQVPSLENVFLTLTGREYRE